jgi:hypothetical protein
MCIRESFFKRVACLPADPTGGAKPFGTSQCNLGIDSINVKWYTTPLAVTKNVNNAEVLRRVEVEILSRNSPLS